MIELIAEFIPGEFIVLMIIFAWMWLSNKFGKDMPDHDCALYVHAIEGKYYVEYPEGYRSQNFSYEVACDYAKMFNGRVVRDLTR